MAKRGWRPRSTSATRRPRLQQRERGERAARSRSRRWRRRRRSVTGDVCMRDGCRAQHVTAGRAARDSSRGGGRAARRCSAGTARTARDPRDRRTPGRARARASSASAKLRSMSSRSGARNDPAAASASIAPLPGRVGTSDTTEAPQANAASTERSSHASCSCGGNERRRDQQEDAQRHAAIRAAPRRPRAKPFQREALVQPIERVRMRGLQSHRHFELRRLAPRVAMAVERGEQPIDARGPRAPDATRRSRATTRRATRRSSS